MSSIGSGPGIGSGSQLDVSALRGVGAVDARSVNVATTQADTADTTAATGQSTTAQAASVVTTNAFTAGEIPVDHQRVTEIKKALEAGTYPVIPTKIGDAMIAAGLMLRTAQ